MSGNIVKSDRKGTARLDELVNVYKFNNEWTQIRFIGGWSSYYEFWIPILTTEGSEVKIPKLCLDWNSQRHRMDSSICPYRKAGLPGRAVYYSNAIIRHLQNSKVGDVETASPVKVLKIPPRLHQDLQNLAFLNRRIMNSGKRKTYDLAHPKWGRDVMIKANPSTPYSYYDLRNDERIRLTKQEREYPLSRLDAVKTETLKKAEAEWHQLSKNYVSDKF